MSISAVTDSTVTLAWTKADEQNFAAYDVYAGLTDAFDTTDSPSVRIEFSFDTTKTIRRLKPETRYFFRVFVKNQSGLVRGSNMVDTMTLRDRRFVNLFRPQVDSVLDTVVHLRWTRCGLADFGAYAVYCDTTEAKVDTGGVPMKRVRITESTDTTADITGLRRGKTYWFQVHVEGFYEDFVASSQTQSVSIDSTVPGEVRLRVDTTLAQSVTLAWSPCTSQVFSSYRVFRSADTGITVRASLCTTLTSIDDTVAAIHGLSDTVQTWFRVFAVGRNGLVSGSNEVVNVPVILSVASVTDTSVNLRWTASKSKEFYAYAVYGDTVPNVTEDSQPITQESIKDVLTRTLTHAHRDTLSTWYYRVFHYEEIGSAVQAGVGSNVRVVLKR